MSVKLHGDLNRAFPILGSLGAICCNVGAARSALRYSFRYRLHSARLMTVAQMTVCTLALESQASRAGHLKPQTVRRVDRSHQNAFAIGTVQNRSHRCCVQGQRAYAAHAVACLASNLCERDIWSEDLLKKKRGCIAIEHEIGDVVHGVYPPEGPKRSVLMLKGSNPSSTSRPETLSTNVVGPQT